MLGHRLRRWPNIGPTMAQCLVFAGDLQIYTSTIDMIEAQHVAIV